QTGAIGIAAWCSTMAAALACAGQLATSGVIAWNTVFPAMGGIHALIGIGEALITVLVIRAVSRAHPDLQNISNLVTEGDSRSLRLYGVVAAVGLVLFISPFACSWPDGLEKIAGDLGFEHQAAKVPVFPAPIPDYELPGIESDSGKTILAGLVGLAATLAVFSLIGFSVKRLRSPALPATASEPTRSLAD
ncbi:MAG TPA: PDGLE domain-containing protein, partial [Candidatus Ozemobacteraceae bacterium]|nr:PDGLE domain-containing protein [Candidatus Ozemobacteraceae bacterium]